MPLLGIQHKVHATPALAVQRSIGILGQLLYLLGDDSRQISRTKILCFITVVFVLIVLLSTLWYHYFDDWQCPRIIACPQHADGQLSTINKLLSHYDMVILFVEGKCCFALIG